MAIDNPESAPGNASPGSGTQPDPPGAPESTAEHGPQPAAGRYQPAAGHYQPGQYQPGAGFDRPGYTQDYGPPAFGHQAYGQPGYGQPGTARAPPTATLPAAGPAPGRAVGAASAPSRPSAWSPRLLGGGVGGYVGYESARAAGTGSSTGVLAEPLPPADPNATPLSPVEAVAARVLPSVVQLQVQGVRGGRRGLGHRAERRRAAARRTTTSSRPRRTAAGSSPCSRTARARPRRSSAGTRARTSPCCGPRASPG